MNVLVTGSRLPFAIEQIRKLGRAGHRVDACDSFWSAPGNHSRHAAASFVTAAPRDDTPAFLDDVARIVRTRGIDRIVPSFEEVFYLSRARARIEARAELFAPPFATLARLHDKAALVALARSLGIRVAPTLVASDLGELARACRQFSRFFARPSFTRGGVTLFTNAGPLAGAMRLEACRPTPENPYVVQPFVDGRDLCTYGIAHHGRLAAHVAYVHPLRLEHAGGISFESVTSREALGIVARIVEHTRYHGQISFDFLETRQGLLLVECNPRPTAGLAVMPDAMFDDAMRDRRPRTTRIAPAGMRRQLSLALVRNMLVHPTSFVENMTALTSGTRDIYADPQDPMPMLSQFLAYGRILEHRLKAGRSSRSDLMEGYFSDLTWDGSRTAESHGAIAA